jgi:hypothetical protein
VATNGPIVHLRVIYKHGEPQCNDDASRGKLLTCPQVLCDNPTSRVIWEQAGGMDERSDDLTLQAFLFTIASDFLHALISCDMGLWL